MHIARRLLTVVFAAIFVTCAHQRPVVNLLKVPGGGEAVIRLCDLPWLVVMAKSVPEKYRKTILEGFDYWDIANLPNGAFQTVSDYVVGEPGPSGVVMDDPGVPLPSMIIVSATEDLDPGTFMETTMGHMNEATGCVGVARVQASLQDLEEYPLEYIATAARHEGGHLLGLDHLMTFGAPTLMYPAIDPSAQHPIDANPDEIEAVRRLHP